CLISGCRLHPVDEKVIPAVSGGQAFTVSIDGVKPPNRWWTSLGDKNLTALVEKSLSNNLGLQQARLRIEQADSLEKQAAAGLYPTLDADGGARRRWTDAGTHGDTLAGGLTLSWEADLWRRLTSIRQAAEFDNAAAREDLQATALMLASEVVETYLGIVEQKQQLALLTRQIEVGQTLLGLIELRFSVGESDIVDVYQQRQQLASTKSQLPLIKSRRRVLENRLKILVARSPSDSPEAAAEDMPKLPPLPKVGVPSTLLTNRPDLRRIRYQLIAADHRVAEAIADRLPRLQLGLDRGYDGSDFRRLTSDGLFTSLMGDLAGPVVDFGRRKAEVQRRRSIVKERLLEFSETYLTAIGEVEDALWRERRQQELIKALDAELDIARRNLKETRIRFSRAALTDYLPVLAAVQSLQALERNLLTRRRELVSIRILLYRALGGAEPFTYISTETQDKSDKTPDFGRKN
ncbi:MAG: TolC family protein, partial [Phycisphaerae bacterium]|nr:TolC family protein [Phycisphaerae bacterium]